MKCLIKTNNIVTISFAQAVLDDAGIDSFVMDQAMSVLEGSMLMIPQRLMVIDEDETAARKALIDAELADELEPET